MEGSFFFFFPLSWPLSLAGSSLYSLHRNTNSSSLSSPPLASPLPPPSFCNSVLLVEGSGNHMPQLFLRDVTRGRKRYSNAKSWQTAHALYLQNKYVQHEAVVTPLPPPPRLGPRRRAHSVGLQIISCWNTQKSYLELCLGSVMFNKSS